MNEMETYVNSEWTPVYVCLQILEADETDPFVC